MKEQKHSKKEILKEVLKEFLAESMVVVIFLVTIGVGLVIAMFLPKKLLSAVTFEFIIFIGIIAILAILYVISVIVTVVGKIKAKLNQPNDENIFKNENKK